MIIANSPNKLNKTGSQLSIDQELSNIDISAVYDNKSSAKKGSNRGLNKNVTATDFKKEMVSTTSAITIDPKASEFNKS